MPLFAHSVTMDMCHRSQDRHVEDVITSTIT